MINTPIAIIAASNLVGNIGLAPNAQMVSLSTTVSTNELVARYANLQPGTTNGTTLAARSFSVVSLGLPLYIANANITISNVASHYGNIMPAATASTYNIPKFASVLSSAGGFLQNSRNLSAAIESLKDASFSDLGLFISDYTDISTNGISNIFANGETSSVAIKQNITTIANAIAGFGTAFDIKNYGFMHRPAVFISQLLKQGFYYQKDADLLGYTLPANWQQADDEALYNFLSFIDQQSINKVLSQTKIVTYKTVTDLGQLLDLEYVFPTAAIPLVQDRNLSGLANMLLNIGGSFSSFNELSSMLLNIEIPDLGAIDSNSELVPAADYSNVRSKLGYSVSGGSPTIVDVVGSIAGVTHIDSLTTINNSLTTTITYTEAQSLSTAMYNLANYCASGNVTLIDSGITQLWTAANTFKSKVASDEALSNVSISGNTAVTSMLSQVGTELTNLSLAGITLSTASGSVGDVLSMTNSLDRFGIDRDNLGYSTLFRGMVQNNAGGQAILGCLVDSKNENTQRAYSVPVTARSV